MKRLGFWVAGGVVLGLLGIATIAGGHEDYKTAASTSVAAPVVVATVTPSATVVAHTVAHTIIPAPSKAIVSVTPIATTAPVATLVPDAATTPATTGLSNNDYYTNSNGNEVHSPADSNSVPAGATAQCTDGTYSFSQHRSGTCSYHGGVASWL